MSGTDARGAVAEAAPEAAPEAALAAARTAAAEAARIAELDAAVVTALEAEQGAGHPPQAEPAAVIAVGATVRLAGGTHVVVRGVRRGPDGVRLLGPGDTWVEAAGAVVVGSAGG